MSNPETAPQPTTIQKKPNIILTSNFIEQQQFWRNIWCIKPPADHTIQDMMKPIYWSHVAKKLNQYDKLEILPADKSYYAELIVINSSVAGARVELISFVDFADKEANHEVDDNGYEVKYKGPSGKWTILRLADKAKIQDKFETKEDANEFLKTYLKNAA